MMEKLYVVSKYITFIGAILKGFWEHLYCRILGVPVQDARYLQANELCGHVEHDFTKSRITAFLICYLPGLMNRMFGYGMFLGGFLGLFHVQAGSENVVFWVYVVMLYLGVSLFCNNAPLYEDALNNWDLLYGKEAKTNIIVKILAFIPSVYALVSAWMEKHALSLLVYIIWIALAAIL